MVVCSAAGLNALSSGPWILLEDLSLVYSDVEVERAPGKHGHKKRKMADGREKTTVRGSVRWLVLMTAGCCVACVADDSLYG